MARRWVRAQAGQVQTVPRRVCSTIQVSAAGGTGVPHNWQAPGGAVVSASTGPG